MHAHIGKNKQYSWDAPAFPTPTIPTQVNESAKQQAMASVRFYECGINKDSKPPVMCVTGVDPRAEFFLPTLRLIIFFRLRFG